MHNRAEHLVLVLSLEHKKLAACGNQGHGDANACAACLNTMYIMLNRLRDAFVRKFAAYLASPALMLRMV